MVLSEPGLFSLLFALPFWAAWLFVAGMLIWQLFGRELIQVDQDGIYFERYAWIRISQRAIPRKEILGFDKCKSLHTENDEHLWGIEARTVDKPLRFLFDLPTHELIWLIHRFNEFYGTQSTYLDPKPQPLHEVLSLDNSLAEPPSDCRWELERDSQAIHFRRRGRINWVSLLVSLFVCVFWNGIVSVFLLCLLGLAPMEQPLGNGEWWGLFFFLIPFEIIGACLLFVFLRNLFQPLHVTAWKVTSNFLVGYSSWPIATFRKTRKIDRWDRIELRESDGKSNWSFSSPRVSGDNFSLVLLDTKDTDCCTIVDLTQGEARWMAYQLRTYRSHWFEKA